MIRMGY
jgi:hypothetical protein